MQFQRESECFHLKVETVTALSHSVTSPVLQKYILSSCQFLKTNLKWQTLKPADKTDWKFARKLLIICYLKLMSIKRINNHPSEIDQQFRKVVGVVNTCWSLWPKVLNKTKRQTKGKVRAAVLASCSDWPRGIPDLITPEIRKTKENRDPSPEL